MTGGRGVLAGALAGQRRTIALSALMVSGHQAGRHAVAGLVGAAAITVSYGA
jgi:putative ABC transport system ATP-binding protein